jgi:hypothetical protein
MTFVRLLSVSQKKESRKQGKEEGQEEKEGGKGQRTQEDRIEEGHGHGHGQQGQRALRRTRQ